MTNAQGSDDLEDRLRAALDEAGVPGLVSAYLFGSLAVSEQPVALANCKSY